MTFQTMPKVELHLHHEGAAPPEFVRGIAKEKKVDISGVFNEQGQYAYSDFEDFLRIYEVATSVLTKPEDYARLTRAVLEELAEHGVIYAETFLSPDFCGGGDVKAWMEYLAAMVEVAEQAEQELGVTLRGIVTCIRHFGPEKSRPVARCAAETAGDWLVGFGMAGAEMVGAPGDFAWAFDCAREAGLRLTCHAGEWGGAKMVSDTLDQLPGIERIGHGVGAVSDPALMKRLADTGVVLEVCPGSNVALGVTQSFSAHPINTLREAGVKVCISTDDPPFFHTTMTREYEELSRAFGWEEDDFTALNRVAAEAAFCDEDTRARILKGLET
ncbi:adenosine deaminase [Vannielia sp.]|uniref:adenosine deaminase n=1 Tax=Vannielia sp. TaxID=2813045 RepID=UPI0026146CDF|nr:adenosine deaminase [Vannielia sp.]MDF1873140.1 adenosine deaminase [Vannielia sp.]